MADMRKSQKRCLFSLFGVAGVFVASAASIEQAAADKIKHSIAVFSGLDKITGRIISFEVATNETVQFGTLQITERVGFTRPPTEAPQTDTFVEVDEVGTDNKTKRIFTGWMFAARPGLHALDHPVYDIWLTNQKGWCGNYKYDYNDIHVIRHLYVLGERYYSPSDQYYEIALMEKGEFDRVEKSEQYKNAIRRYRRFAPVSMDNDI